MVVVVFVVVMVVMVVVFVVVVTVLVFVVEVFVVAWNATFKCSLSNASLIKPWFSVSTATLQGRYSRWGDTVCAGFGMGKRQHGIAGLHTHSTRREQNNTGKGVRL